LRSEEHITIGVIIGGSLGILVGNVESYTGILNIAIALIFGGFGASIPDTLEPATSWRHRGSYHSQRALQILILGLVFILLVLPLWVEEPIGYVLIGTIGGYISHLLLDGTTSMGLPI
jgi:membrane-bound metal-dependent hydrolase YbcI (DUF457 family)